jgi:outer membrane protein OmpA-like peptidoglycan-associated protein
MHHRLIAAALSISLPAVAQAPAEVNLSLFRPATGSDGTASVEGAQPIGEGPDAVEATVSVDAAFRPVRSASGTVSRRVGGWVGLQGRLDPRLSVFVQVPVTLEESASFGTVGSGFGDVRLGLRGALGRLAGIDFGALAAIDLATSQAGALTGDARAGGELLAVASWRKDRWRLLGNLFTRFRPPRDFGGAQLGNEIGLRAAAAYDARTWLTPFVELEGQTSLRALSGLSAPAEWRVGARACALPWLMIEAGVGTRLDAGLGAPDARAVVALRYAPATCAAPPRTEPEAEAKELAAAIAAERARQTTAQQREREAQRRALVEQLATGTRNAEENAKGNATTLRVADEKDTDNDGIPDVRDNCPTEPGPVINHGCPVANRQLVGVRPAGIEISDKVFFAFGRARVEKRSYRLLDQVAAVMIRHPNLLKLEVAGHTDNIGSDQTNLKLSNARARAVVDYLVRHAVSPDRLVPHGYGPSRPLAPNLTAKGREQNRRVEFRVLQRRADGLVIDEAPP